MVDIKDNRENVTNQERVARLNQAFMGGKEGWEVIDDLRAIKRPILVDFNNVLASNSSPLTINPESKQLLDGLRQIGDVVIATTAQGWEPVHDFLKENNLWSDEIVLMVSPNWGFLSSSQHVYGESQNAKDDLLGSYVEHLKTRGIELTELDEWAMRHAVGASKPLAPLFNKNFDIPLVDDSLTATKQPFPGILGVTFKPFLGEEEKKYNRGDYGLSVSDTISTVKEYYSKINIK